MNDIIITTGPLGGLGDWMVYTSLPERFAKLGHDVYLDRDNVCRNDEISDLLFAMNPYVKGDSDKKPNAGYINQGAFYEIASRFPIGCIEAMERAHGLEPPYSIAPKIYYQPQPFHVNLSDAILFDLSAISSAIPPVHLNAVINHMKMRFPDKRFVRVAFPEGVTNPTPLGGSDEVRMNSIYEYCDAIASCHAIVCSEAGSQALAAAVRGEHDVYEHARTPQVISIISPKTHNSRGYTFRGVDYLVFPPPCGDQNHAGDIMFWSPAEVPHAQYQLLCRRGVEEARRQWIAARAAKESA